MNGFIFLHPRLRKNHQFPSMTKIEKCGRNLSFQSWMIPTYFVHFQPKFGVEFSHQPRLWHSFFPHPFDRYVQVDMEFIFPQEDGIKIKHIRNQHIHWVWPPHSNSGKLRFLGIPYSKCDNAGGHCYWEGATPNIYIVKV